MDFVMIDNTGDGKKSWCKSVLMDWSTRGQHWFVCRIYNYHFRFTALSCTGRHHEQHGLYEINDVRNDSDSADK